MHFWHLLTQVSGGDGLCFFNFLPSLVIGDWLVIFVDVFSCSLQVLSSSKTVFLWGIMYCCIRISSARATLICKSFSAVFFIQCILYLVRKLQKLNNWKNKKEKKKRTRTLGEPEGFGKNANNSIMKQWKICLSVSSLLLDSVLCALRLCHCCGVLVEFVF